VFTFLAVIFIVAWVADQVIGDVREIRRDRRMQRR
jgi:hypothetical protein